MLNNSSKVLLINITSNHLVPSNLRITAKQDILHHVIIYVTNIKTKIQSSVQVYAHYVRRN